MPVSEMSWAAQAGAGLFMIAWFVAAGSWCFGVAEALGCFLLAPWAYRMGIVAWTEETASERPAQFDVPANHEVPFIKYRVLADDTCVFRRTIELFEFRWNTPFAIKGEAAWRNGKLKITGRYPLGPMLFFLAWLVGWTVGGLVFMSQNLSAGLPFTAMGWLFAGGMVVHSRNLEMSRFFTYSGLVKKALLEPRRTD